jgi:ligand-binding sensor protein
MKLTELLPLENWMELETEIHRRFGLDANVFDTAGVRISEFKAWVNRLCPEIKATDRGQSFICAVAHMNIAGQAMQTRQPVAEECDAGLVKIVVPVFLDDQFLGAVGACGVLLDDGEVDTFLIEKIAGIEEETTRPLAEGIGAITSGQAEEIVQFIQEKIRRIVDDYKLSRKA